MDQDGNMVIPHGDDFSSPNIQPDTSDNEVDVSVNEPVSEPETEPKAEPISEPAVEQPQINEAPGIINSGAIMSATSSGSTSQARSRFNFGTNRFHVAESQPTTTPITSANPIASATPSFMQEAMAASSYNNSNSKKKKIIIAAVAAVVIVVAALVIATKPWVTPVNKQMSDQEISEKIIGDSKKLRHLESLYNEIARKDIDIDELMKDGYCNEITEGVEAYNTLKPLIGDYAGRTDSGYKYAEDLKKSSDALKEENIPADMGERCSDAVNYLKKNGGNVDKYGADFKNALDELDTAYNMQVPRVACPEEATVVTSQCKQYWEARSKKKEAVQKSNDIISSKIFNITSTIKSDKLAGRMLVEMAEKMISGAKR